MTENLISRLEEKLMVILTELEKLRAEAFNLKQENAALRTEREKVEERLKGLVSLFDAVNGSDAVSAVSNAGVINKPVLVQG